MRNKFLKKLIAATVIISTAAVIMPQKADAAWINNYYGGWAYSNGYYLVTGWNNIDGTWYYFNSQGLMQTGWLNSGGLWYYLDRSGAMQTGVIQVEGKIYLLGPSGAMQTGPAVVNGKMYYFGADGVCIGSEVPTPLKGYDYYGNPVQPYVPSQIVNTNAAMDTVIPTDNGVTIDTEYRIHYKDDDGETLLTKRIDSDTRITLYEPEKAGYEFVEWNTKKNGNGTSYEAGDKLKLTSDITLYAQWDEIEDKDDDEENIKVTSIKILKAGESDEKILTVNTGDTIQLVRRISPSNATNTKVTWKVTNRVNNTNGEATIDSNGKLKAVTPGTVTVRATANDGSKVYKEIKVIIED